MKIVFMSFICAAYCVQGCQISPTVQCEQEFLKDTYLSLLPADIMQLLTRTLLQDRLISDRDYYEFDCLLMRANGDLESAIFIKDQRIMTKMRRGIIRTWNEEGSLRSTFIPLNPLSRLNTQRCTQSF